MGKVGESLPAIARVEVLDLLTELRAIDVGIDLGRSDVFVPEHELDGLEISTPFEQSRGEAVTEGMGADRLGDACHLGRLTDEDEDGDA